MVVAKSVITIGGSATGGSLAARTSAQEGGGRGLEKRESDIGGGVRLNLIVNEYGYVGDVLDDMGILITYVTEVFVIVELFDLL